VNEPHRAVVLVLGAYEPSIWTVKWSASTQIVGVWISGYYAQQIAGLGKGIPLLRSNYTDGGTCPHFYIAEQQVAQVSSAVNKVLGRGIDKLVLASNGRVAISSGAAAASYQPAETRSVESFRDVTVPLAGDAGIEELLRSGKLRRATQRDYNQWRALSGGQAPRITVSALGGSNELFRTYVVLRSMTIPADLYGAKLVTLIVPRGVERPRGDPGH
jgi:hypothetical protein